jgi:hypothetical protein
MGAEYVRFTQEETTRTQTNFLESQVHILQGLKRFKTYRLLRNEELQLKIKLKTQIDALNEQLAVVDRLLPQTEFKFPHPKQTHTSKESTEKTETADTYSLEDELAAIHKKLQALK